MNKNNTKLLKAACYMASMSTSVAGNLSPILFLTFRSLYGISYSLLGSLVLINFLTQLTVDLIFSFFSHKFNIHKAVKFTPVLGAIGLLIFAASPFIFPNAIYLGLVIGTVIFSASNGLAEVLLSPVIAALPAKDPDREMSKFHSVYAWGVVGVIIISTVFLFIFGQKKWQYLPTLFSLIPITSAILFAGCKIPDMNTPQKVSGVLSFLKRPVLWLCVFGIFLGGAVECTMAQWCSGYIEKALGIEKIWGDMFGVASFALALGIGRALYGKIGKDVGKWLFLGAIGASACYIIAAISTVPFIGMCACGITGFCVSMMWPGSLVIAERKIPDGGIFIFAMMASGGDLGASVGPQMVGLITDAVITSPIATELAIKLEITSEQLGMKFGMLIGALFPLVAIAIYTMVRRSLKNETTGTV